MAEHTERPGHVFRTSVREFITDLVGPDSCRGIGALDDQARRDFRVSTRAALAERGWVAPNSPVQYGPAGWARARWWCSLRNCRPLGSPSAPTMTHWHRHAWQHHALMGQTRTAETVSAQDRLRRVHLRPAFLRPGACSDLASLALRADPDGNQWALNGQKLWSSSAHVANWMFVLARTNRDAPRHRGISMLLVPIDQPAVEVRPIRNITGDTDFNEVFFDGAVTERELVVGEVDGGWPVAMTLLGFERGEAALHAPIRFRSELDRLIDVVRERGLEHDSDIRRRVAWCHVQVEQLRCHGVRTISELVNGEEPGPQAASFKLLWSEYHKVVTELAMDIIGLDALTPTGRPSPNWYHTDDPGAPNSSASWSSVYLNARAGTIYAGSSQVQRSIVGELLLGLPKEPRPTSG